MGRALRQALTAVASGPGPLPGGPARVAALARELLFSPLRLLPGGPARGFNGQGTGAGRAMDLEQVEVLCKGEELLARARTVARAITRSTWNLMQNNRPAARPNRDGTAGMAGTERSEVRPADTPFAHGGGGAGG